MKSKLHVHFNQPLSPKLRQFVWKLALDNSKGERQVKMVTELKKIYLRLPRYYFKRDYCCIGELFSLVFHAYTSLNFTVRQLYLETV